MIREEHVTDVDAIDRLTRDAFAPMSFSDGSEAPILRRLRSSGDLILSLVAVGGEELVGHVAFSPVLIDGRHDGWFGLGPISVRADHQRRGIGSALTAAGLSRLREAGARGVVLIGNPDVYRSMGFVSDSQLKHDGVDSALVQYVTFRDYPPAGDLQFAPAFAPRSSR